MNKPEKNRRRIRIGIGIVIVILTAGIMLSLQISTFTVTGNTRYTKEEMINFIFKDRISRNPLYCYYTDHFREHAKIPFVEDYKIEYKNPLEVEIIVYEKSVVGYVSYMGSYMYFDKDGIIVESTGEKLEDIPLISGLKFGHIILHQPLPVENGRIFEEILNLTQVLSINGIQVDKVQYNVQEEATLTMGEIEVVLGGSEGISGKIAELKDMLPQLKGLSGTLYLDAYDENNSNQTFTFKKK